MDSFGVVVPAFNEAELLPACLASLLEQDWRGELDVVVVDNASTDGTGDIARAMGVRVVEEPVRGYGRALRTGFAAVRGECIAVTDADTIVPTDWLSRFAAAYALDPDVVAVGGGIEFANTNRRGRLLTRGLLPIVTAIDRRNPAGPHLWGANLSVRREAFERVGGWNPAFSFQTDTELSERLRAVGRVIVLPQLKVSTSARRWNRAPVSSVLQSASNFAWFHLCGRPLFREFRSIRERRAPARKRRRLIGAGGLAALLTLGYMAFAPWSHAFGTTEWSGPTGQKVVALTFDDGPEEPYTSQVLAELEKERVPATFFLVGENVELDPAAAAREARDGDSIGNHTDTHTPAFALEPEWLQARDLKRAERTIHSATGIYPHLFRPPQGLRSPWLMALAASDSLLTVTWDDAPRDWERRSAGDLVRSTLEQVHPGAIILLHDGLNLDHRSDRSATVQALPGIIRGLRQQGYRFVTLPALLHVPASLEEWRPGRALERALFRG